MNVLLNGEHPRNIGVPCQIATGQRLALQTHLTRAPAAWPLAEPGDPECGVLATLDGDALDRFGLPADTHAVVWWTDDEGESEIRTLTEEQAGMLLAESESAIVQTVIEHYRTNPEDDGHPAYLLYQRAAAYESRENGSAENAPETGEGEDAGTSAPGAATGGGLTLQVIVAEDGGAYSAQALELDYAAAGDSVDDAVARFRAGLRATLKAGADPDKLQRNALGTAWRDLAGTAQVRVERHEPASAALGEEAVKLPFRSIAYAVART